MNTPAKPVGQKYSDLCASLWALSALRVAVESELLSALATQPRQAASLSLACGLNASIIERILDVLVANEVAVRDDQDTYALTDEGRSLVARSSVLRADLAATFGQTRSMVEEARRSGLDTGWRHGDREVIEAQGLLSHDMTQRMLAPLLEAWPQVGVLLGRDGACLLDVGVGAAGGAIAFCRRFPKLRAVGIDRLGAAILVAKDSVTIAGLGDRVELRQQRAEELKETEAFDVAFVASRFFGDEALAATLVSVAPAMKRDGCLLLSGYVDCGDARRTAASRLREQLWGGGPRPASTVRTMAERAGFKRVLQAPPQGDIVPMLAFVS